MSSWKNKKSNWQWVVGKTFLKNLSYLESSTLNKQIT